MDRYSDGSNHWDKQPDGSFRPTPRRKQTQYTGQRPLFWKGTYDGSCYRPGDVVSDDGWLMTPNTTTCDKPAPNSEDWDVMGVLSVTEDGVWLRPEPDQSVSDGISYAMLWELDTHEDAPTSRSVEWTNHGVRVTQAGMYYVTFGVEVRTDNVTYAWRANAELWKGTDLSTGSLTNAVQYERHRMDFSSTNGRISQMVWLEAGATFSGVVYISGISAAKPIEQDSHASWLRITRVSP